MSAKPSDPETTIPNGEAKTAVLSVRIRADLKAQLDQPRIGPYRISITDIVERGTRRAQGIGGKPMSEKTTGGRNE